MMRIYFLGQWNIIGRVGGWKGMMNRGAERRAQ